VWHFRIEANLLKFQILVELFYAVASFLMKGLLMPNTRQVQIIRDLENATNPITAASLANKYGVSLRTLQNDINVIAAIAKKQNCRFIRLPGVGLKLISSINLAQEIHYNPVLADYYNMEPIVQDFVLFTLFALKHNPITLKQIESLFAISKITITRRINRLNSFLINKNLEIIGIRNKGYVLKGSTLSILDALSTFLNSVSKEFALSFLFGKDHLFFHTQEQKRYDLCVESFMKQLKVDTIDILSFKVLLLSLIQIILNHRIVKNESSADSSPSMKLLYAEFCKNFNLSPEHECIEPLKYIIVKTSDFQDITDSFNHENKYTDMVDFLLIEISKKLPPLEGDLEILKLDLLRHFAASNTRQLMNLPNENLLLPQIKSRYSDVFAIVKQVTPQIQKKFHITLSEDEIGFITLYIKRSLEKEEQLREAKVMIVCNTGRGSSKLLATRIMNNFPELHIVAMSSYYDLKEFVHIMEDVDLIISTVPLEQIEKPYVVVSPFLTEIELIKVKEAIYIGSQTHSSKFFGPLDEAVNSLFHQYTNQEELHGLSSQLSSIITQQVNFPNEEIAERVAMIMMEVFNLFQSLFPEGILHDEFGIISGISAHIIMAIPRWLKGDFIVVYDADELKARKPSEYEIIVTFLKKIEQQLGTYIDIKEAIAILRYII
jgi:transcriptional antiterminator